MLPWQQPGMQAGTARWDVRGYLGCFPTKGLDLVGFGSYFDEPGTSGPHELTWIGGLVALREYIAARKAASEGWGPPSALGK